MTGIQQRSTVLRKTRQQRGTAVGHQVSAQTNVTAGLSSIQTAQNVLHSLGRNRVIMMISNQQEVSLNFTVLFQSCESYCKTSGTNITLKQWKCDIVQLSHNAFPECSYTVT